MDVPSTAVAQIVIPSQDVLRACIEPWALANYIPFLRGMVRASGAVVTESMALVPYGGLAVPILVDGVRVVIDMNDYGLPRSEAWGEDHWLFYFHTPNLLAYPRFGYFASPSFSDWDLYRRLRAEVRYTAESDIVLNNQYVLDPPPDDRNRRRLLLREALRPVRDRVDETRTDQETFLRKAGSCLCYVHSPGSWPNMLDRNPAQLMGLGVCVIQPEILTTLGARRPVPGQHYLACADDYADVADLVWACAQDRAWCRQIGANAAALFARSLTPGPTWNRVLRRICGTEA
jgi:hypothetical protein